MTTLTMMVEVDEVLYDDRPSTKIRLRLGNNVFMEFTILSRVKVPKHICFEAKLKEEHDG